jgi:sphingomyelin phosphodiesterase acid-like 3
MRLRPAALFLLLISLVTASAHAQSVPVLMLSDIHFDPFHDPAKVAQLRTEPIDRWPAILNSAPSATQAADLQSLQSTCRSRALDTAWPLLKTTVLAAHDASAHPLFLTLSGDLLTHEFPCRFQHTAPNTTPQDLAAFSAKTIAFVLAQLRQSFPRTPIYASLGNNDSGCADYRETPNDLFLKQTAEALRAATLDPNLTLTAEGDYNVPLPAPMAHARLIVLQDVFEARQFATCGGNTDRAPEKAQMDWLRTQLADARAHNDHVWVMGHIPPGIDVYTSFRHYILQPAELCNATPRPFLADTTLQDALLDYADTVRLALFGHTHMDEIRLLHRDPTATSPRASIQQDPSQDSSSQPERATLNSSSRPERAARSGETSVFGDARAGGTSQPPTNPAAIPAKLVPSVTPYVGNHPAFLLATVDPHTATLKDWRTFISPGTEGSTPPWTEAYRFTTAFHLPDFSAESALKLSNEITADKTGQSPESTAFRQHFYPGDIGIYALGLAQIWPAYACAVREDRPSAVHNCICEINPAPKPLTDQP